MNCPLKQTCLSETLNWCVKRNITLNSVVGERKVGKNPADLFKLCLHSGELFDSSTDLCDTQDVHICVEVNGSTKRCINLDSHENSQFKGKDFTDLCV